MQVETTFFSLNADFQLPNTSIMIPTSLKRYGLSEVVNILLKTPQNIQFDFIIKTTFLRKSIQEYLDQHNISHENHIQIQVCVSTSPPQKLDAFATPDWISAVSIGACEERIAVGGFDSTLRVFNYSGETVKCFQTQAQVNCVDWVGEDMVAAGDQKHIVAVYSVCGESAETGSVFECHGHTGSIQAIKTNRSGSHFASASWDKTVRIWMCGTEDLRKVDSSPSKKGKKRAKTSSVQVKNSVSVLEGHSGAVTCLAHDPDATTLYTGSYDHSLRVWDVPTETNTRTLASCG